MFEQIRLRARLVGLYQYIIIQVSEGYPLLGQIYINSTPQSTHN